MSGVCPTGGQFDHAPCFAPPWKQPCVLTDADVRAYLRGFLCPICSRYPWEHPVDAPPRCRHSDPGYPGGDRCEPTPEEM